MGNGVQCKCVASAAAGGTGQTGVQRQRGSRHRLRERAAGTGRRTVAALGGGGAHRGQDTWRSVWRLLSTLAAGGWRLAAGGWRLAAGGWRLAAGGWRLAAG